MPAGGRQQFDFRLGQFGYMLARGQFKGRAWRRTGHPNAVRPLATDADLQRNALPPELDFVATYDDFSGGFGDAYRDPSTPTRIHWSQNMETRFPRQAIHCQGPRTLENSFTTSPSGGSVAAHGTTDARWFLQVPPLTTGAKINQGGGGAILMYGVRSPLVSATISLHTYSPTGLSATGQQFTRSQDSLGFNGASSGNEVEVGRPAIFGSFVWIGTNPGASLFVRRRLDAPAGIAATFAPLPGSVFAVAGSRMWRAFSPNIDRPCNALQSIAFGADPMVTANWSATLSIGSGQENARDMVALDDQLYVSTTKGLYAGDTSGTFYNVLSDMVRSDHYYNGRQLTIHENSVIYPHAGGMIAYEPGVFGATAREVGPGRSSSRSPVSGQFVTVTSYAGWLYGGLFTGSSGFLCAARRLSDGRYAWYVQQRIGDGAEFINSIQTVAVDTISKAPGGETLEPLPSRMWLGISSFPENAGVGTEQQVRWWPMPRSDGNPVGDLNFSPNYCGSARTDFGRDNRGAPETKKVLRRVDVNTDASTFLSGSRYADVYYMIDGQETRTLLGRAQESPRSTLFFPSGQGSFVTCYDWELSVESFTGSLSHTPVYRSFVVHGAFLTEGPDEITAVVDVASGRADRVGTPMRPGSVQLAELRSMAGDVPQMLTDLTGAQQWVTVQRNVEEQENYQEGEDYPEVAATIRLSVLSFSTN